MAEAEDVVRVWTEDRRWLESHAPGAFANLARGASEAELGALRSALEPTLPEPFVAILRLNNGQRDPAGCCTLPGLEFLSTARIVEEWQNWKEFRDGETQDGLD